MRVFISGLVLALAGLWPQFVKAEEETKQTRNCPNGPTFKELCWRFLYESCSPPPPVMSFGGGWNWGFFRDQHWPFSHPVFSWSNRFSPSFDCLQDDDLLAAKDEFLLFVAVRGTKTDHTTDQVTLLSGDQMIAQQGFSGGLAVFSVKGDLLEQNLTIKVTSVEAAYTVYFGWQWDSWRILRYMLIPPEAVEVFVLPQAVSKVTDLPGFHGKSVTSRECPVYRHLHPDLALRTRSSFHKLAAAWDEREYTTRPFCLNDTPANLRPRLASKVKLLGEHQNAINPPEIKPVDWRIGRAGNSLNVGLCDEYRLLVPLEGQKPETIIIRSYPEPPNYEDVDGVLKLDSRKALFNYWISLFR